jgi:transcriptional regulator with XRE-family HTH domain
MTSFQLADALHADGLRWDRSILANLESGRRRDVSVNELLALARCLGVAPVHLIVPIDADRFRVSPGAPEVDADVARAWICGDDAGKRLAADEAMWYRHRPIARPRPRRGTATARGAPGGRKTVEHTHPEET